MNRQECKYSCQGEKLDRIVEFYRRAAEISQAESDHLAFLLFAQCEENRRLRLEIENLRFGNKRTDYYGIARIRHDREVWPYGIRGRENWPHGFVVGVDD